MYLTYRPAQSKDLEQGFRFLSDRYAFAKADQPRLLSFWRYLIKGRMVRSVVVEDRTHSPSKPLLSFAMSLFVTEDFAQLAKTTLPPPLSRRVFEQWLKGRRVFLNHNEIARHNSTDGLNLLVLHHGWDQRPLPEVMEIRGKMLEAFFLFHSGYQIKEYFQNVFGEEDRQAMLGQGFRLLRDYQECPQDARGPGGSRIYLTGADREEPYSSENAFIHALFTAPSPRFGFTTGEKDVLERALFGETDQETARSLHFTVWAVKKRWQGIYGKVERIDPHALDASHVTSPGKGKPEKIERRRFMLDYLRHHLEEIRPTLPARRKNFLKGR